jgi:excinuclease ABC subunit C
MVNTNSELVRAKVKSLPSNSGVYLMKDINGKIIYVGKAINLSNRVKSYFTGNTHTPKTNELVKHICDIEYYVTNTEAEALVLELNLIKRYRPYYNIALKDDKGFPYIRINLNDEWPTVDLVRSLHDDGAKYFGPFSSARSIRITVETLRNMFPFRNCEGKVNTHRTRPCIEYDMHKCTAPCMGYISHEDYRKIILNVISFLEGKDKQILKQLKEQMDNYSENLEFEKAAEIRDRIQSIEKILNWQKMSVMVKGNLDAIAFARDDNQCCVQVFMIRNSSILGREQFILKGTADESDSMVMSSFVEQYYSVSTNIPGTIITEFPVENEQVIKDYLREQRNAAVTLSVPTKGARKSLIKIVKENAEKGLVQMRIKNTHLPSQIKPALEELKEILKLDKIPRRIEGYDISNTQGHQSVGSMVVFEDGKPANKKYRKYKIRTVEGPNDFASLMEVLTRRLTHVGEDFATTPDIILIDGGKGQLNSVMEAVHKLGDFNITFISLAKQHEEIFIPGEEESLKLPESSLARQLLQRVRDESHRYAIGFHRSLRDKNTFVSLLDVVPGIGPKKKQALMKSFGSVDNIRQASVEELAEVVGNSSAQKIKQYL